MSIENWKTIQNFENYSVSDLGSIRSEKSGRILALNQNQYGNVNVGLVRNGRQFHRSVSLLVAKAFLAPLSEIFDTPIHRDGNRWNNALENLLWRPRWYAVKYNQQFRYPYLYSLNFPIQDIKTGEVSQNSFHCAIQYGLLESDIVLATLNHTYVWPTYQIFQIVED